jgi:phage replication-related protein YjqB (UPF0714/DUF867 family)
VSGTREKAQQNAGHPGEPWTSPLKPLIWPTGRHWGWPMRRSETSFKESGRTLATRIWAQAVAHGNPVGNPSCNICCLLISCMGIQNTQYQGFCSEKSGPTRICVINVTLTPHGLQERMVDSYASYTDLATSEKEGRDFRVSLRRVRHAPLAVVAPHGGGIEPGTSEIADRLADRDFSYYAFEGLKSCNNRILHIRSTEFDEQRCLELISTVPMVVSVHGRNDAGSAIWVGGLDKFMKERIHQALEKAGFEASLAATPPLMGSSPRNLCNRGTSGAGMQLELSLGLRARLFFSLETAGRRNPTDLFSVFIGTLRAALFEALRKLPGTTPVAVEGYGAHIPQGQE